MPKNNKKTLLLNFIDTLKGINPEHKNDRTGSDDTLDLLINYTNDEHISFIIPLDWKAGIDDLDWHIKLILEQNFQVFLSLNINTDNDITISHDGAFKTFDDALKIYGYQLGFISTDSDEYLILLHLVSDRSAIKKSIDIIGEHNKQFYHDL